MNNCHLTVKNSISELENITLSLENYFEENSLSPALLFEVNLVIEEIFTNIIFYAFSDDNEHLIDIQIINNNTILTIIITDSGIPFDPLSTADPDLNKSIEDREIGGLGIHLVKKFVQHIDYCRKEDKNILTLIKNIPVN